MGAQFGLPSRLGCAPCRQRQRHRGAQHRAPGTTGPEAGAMPTVRGGAKGRVYT
jgi:hypothetical protein